MVRQESLAGFRVEAEKRMEPLCIQQESGPGRFRPLGGCKY